MYGNFKVGQGSIVTTTFIHVPDYLQSGLESHLTLQNQTCNIFGALFSFRVTRRCNYCACVLITNAAMLGGSSGGHNVDRRIRIYSPLCRRCQPVMLGIIYSLIFFFYPCPSYLFPIVHTDLALLWARCFSLLYWWPPFPPLLHIYGTKNK